MKTILEFITIGGLSLLLSLLFTPFIKKIAIKVQLVDKPNHRKIHQEAVPLVGGISIAFTSILVLLISGNYAPLLNKFMPILIAGLTLLIVGVIDDKKDLNAKYKLVIQLLLSFTIAFSGTRITSLYGLFGCHEIDIWLQYLLTVIVITGVVNAFNLMDGVDGLVGSLSLLGFVMLFTASIYFNDYYLGKLCIIFIGTIIGFLRFNLSRKKIFMGDSGSLFLGFILVSIGIHFMETKVTHRAYNYAYGLLLLVSFFSIPVLDSLRVYLGRIKEGNSPFAADKSHLHHLLLNIGLNHKKIALFVVIFALSLFFIGFGLISFFSTTILILSILAAFTIIVKLLLMINQLNDWKKMISKLENR